MQSVYYQNVILNRYLLCPATLVMLSQIISLLSVIFGSDLLSFAVPVCSEINNLVEDTGCHLNKQRFVSCVFHREKNKERERVKERFLLGVSLQIIYQDGRGSCINPPPAAPAEWRQG